MKSVGVGSSLRSKSITRGLKRHCLLSESGRKKAHAGRENGLLEPAQLGLERLLARATDLERDRVERDVGLPNQRGPCSSAHLAERDGALFEALDKRPVAVAVQVGLRVLEADAEQQLEIQLGDVVAAVGQHGPAASARARRIRTLRESGTMRPSSMQVIVVWLAPMSMTQPVGTPAA